MKLLPIVAAMSACSATGAGVLGGQEHRPPVTQAPRAVGHARAVSFSFGGLLPFGDESASSFLGLSFGLGDGHGGELAVSLHLHDDESSTPYSFTVPRFSLEWTPSSPPATRPASLFAVRQYRGDTSVLAGALMRTENGSLGSEGDNLSAYLEIRLEVREIVAGTSPWRTRVEAEFRLVGRKVWGGGGKAAAS